MRPGWRILSRATVLSLVVVLVFRGMHAGAGRRVEAIEDVDRPAHRGLNRDRLE